MGKNRNKINFNMWCNANTDLVEDDQRYYRCSRCNRRLLAREKFDSHGNFLGFKLPIHKKKGWKIKLAKARKLR